MAFLSRMAFLLANDGRDADLAALRSHTLALLSDALQLWPSVRCPSYCAACRALRGSASRNALPTRKLQTNMLCLATPPLLSSSCCTRVAASTRNPRNHDCNSRKLQKIDF